MIEIKTTGTQKNGTFIVHNKACFITQVKNLPDGQYEYIIKKKYRKASTSQFGWLFAGIYPEFLKGAIASGWEIPGDNEKERLEYVDGWCKKLFLNRDILNKNTGEYQSIPDLKRKLKTVEMMVYANAIRDHSAEFFSHFIPEPETNFKINI